ncbi:MAG: hypothetical protein PWP24_718, partial [Clostridiales bacterium]|nr:hypothetical protein [Clostridiales bacterium]
LSNLTQLLINQYPEKEQNIMHLIKDTQDIYHNSQTDKDTYLSSYGYKAQDFVKGYIVTLVPFVMLVISILLGLVAFFIHWRKMRERERIEELTRYLEQLNMGKEVRILAPKEDIFSGLQDEIYKTVSTLYKTREDAVAVKENYAKNLANIAHQMKTPLTSMSLMTQLLKERWKEEVNPLQKQIVRLTKLEEALLLLSKIDAGVLNLEKKAVDVYSMLQIAVESLEEVSAVKNCNIKLENTGIVSYMGDMEWSIEAFSNIIKNCMEYAESQVTIEYLKNPLYTQIIIWDDGEGFTKQDITRVFERFYRGSRAKEGGIGIGLSLARSLIFMQNGCVEAKNLPLKGACFVVRFYCH